MTSGILLIHKPRGITSHDVVDYVRKITGVRRVGHAGTLDPLAGGLLIVLVGDATKRQAEFMSGEKEYVATMRLGATSDTDDAEGIIKPTTDNRQPTTTEMKAALMRFVGEIEQMPPAYSAIKIRGKKAYDIARAGGAPDLKVRRVTIKEIELLEYRALPSEALATEGPLLKIRVVCSPGTYIRALARDIGQALGCGAYLEALTRTRSGVFRIEQAVTLQELTQESWSQHLLS